ncbi:NUDIX domain-containing protein [Mucilaginibacter terrae]|uniref:NUDIX family NTP pyrophosphohydrolase n=1 Tax=Mucilaginibacter terrae TaxID=1955052 RepID=A0ABU3H0I4_9SPHI|nr:NUDIX domain-containing protein [Mucilaginibacter terrae]MDT3405523.1 putative NUDIX family NTP pyrophosphohydrolase [Mucilaginibacter terrae]
MPKQSAGLLLYRLNKNELQVFLVHPGGPYYVRKDDGVWSIPKGEYAEDEEPLTAAKREFEEETGLPVNGSIFVPLKPIKQKGGKMVHAWAVEGNADHEKIVSNTFKMEYPYKSGKWIDVPEIDRANWFTVEEARIKINPAQIALIEELRDLLEAQNN